MDIASLIELVVGALTGLHGVGWLLRGRWKVGLVSLGLSLLVNTIFFFLIVPSAGFALIPQLSLQIGWALFSARALHDELRKPATPPYPQLPYPLYPPYPPPYQQPTPQQRPLQQQPRTVQPQTPQARYPQPTPQGQRAPYPTPYPPDAPTLRN